MKPPRRIRLGTMLLLMVVVALLCGLYVQKRRQARLLAALEHYRRPVTEGIYDVLDESMALSYPDGATLEDVLKLIKTSSRRPPKLPAGMPIYVDPIGLQEAGKLMTSPIRRPAAAKRLTLDEHLRRILEPLGLGYEVKDGFLMITSKESLDMALGDEQDLYLQYRDLFR
jgi:hypothetical protein